MKNIFFATLILAFITACGNAKSPHPAPTAAPTAALTLTPIPFPVQTSTPLPTPTISIKQYQICTPENFTDCDIPYQDLYNGNYLKWLYTLPVEEFDISTLHKIRCIGSSHGLIFAGSVPDENYKDNATVRLRRGNTIGVTSVRDGEVGYQFYGVRDFVVHSAYAYSDSLGHGVWLILIEPRGTWSDGEVVDFIKQWNASDRLLVIANKYFSGVESANNSEDPLVVNTFKLIPDMQERLDNYLDSCDPAFISGHGIILETAFSKANK